MALLLCHDLLGLHLSPALRHILEADGRLRVLRSLALRLYQRGGEVKERNDLRSGTTSVYVSRLLVGRACARVAENFAHGPIHRKNC